MGLLSFSKLPCFPISSQLDRALVEIRGKLIPVYNCGAHRWLADGRYSVNVLKNQRLIQQNGIALRFLLALSVKCM